MSIQLSGSVGSGGVNNRDDVKKVQQRLVDLGFTFVGTVDGLVGAKTIRGIKLFQSIKNGRQKLGGDGRVDVNGDTHKWLNAQNAPKWQTMSASGPGYINVEVTKQTSDHHDYGTNWLNDTLKDAAQEYKDLHYDCFKASLMTINDVSLVSGGDTPDHSGHETGLSCDLRLPQENNTSDAAGGRTYNSSDYDRDAARALLKALRAQSMADTSNIFFNDSVLINEGLCTYASHHDDHIHFQIKPPARQ